MKKLITLSALICAIFVFVGLGCQKEVEAGIVQTASQPNFDTTMKSPDTVPVVTGDSIVIGNSLEDFVSFMEAHVLKTPWADTTLFWWTTSSLMLDGNSAKTETGVAFTYRTGVGENGNFPDIWNYQDSGYRYFRIGVWGQYVCPSFYENDFTADLTVTVGNLIFKWNDCPLQSEIFISAPQVTWVPEVPKTIDIVAVAKN